MSADPVDSPPSPAPAVDDVSVASPSGPVAASAVQESEMSDADYLPQSGVESDDPTSMDEVAASGDDEVVAAAPSSSLSDSPRLRRKRRRRTVSPAVPSVLVDMDTSVDEVPGHSHFKTFAESGMTGFPGRFIVPGNLVIKGLKLQSLSHPLLLFFSPPKIFLLLLLLRFLRLPLFPLLFLRMAQLSIP